MTTTTTPPHASGRDAIRKLPPNSNAGAVIPLKSYLQKYINASAAALVPSTPLPPNVKSTHVAFSLWPLLANGPSLYYAGVFDNENHFSASTVKAAALFAAGQFLAEAKATAANFSTAGLFVPAFNSQLQAEINANADQRILSAQIGLQPQTSTILKLTGFPSVAFANGFNTNLTQMIVASSDSAAAVCIHALGYGYISAALKQEQFFAPNTGMGTGIWLAADYKKILPAVRIPCENDHPDAEITTTRQMCRLFAMIRLNWLPDNDPDTNALMQNLLNEPKTGPDATEPWLSGGRNPGVWPVFTIVQDKIGFAGLGDNETPNVYSEGLIIKWNDTSQVDSFNKKIDPTNANPTSHLTGEIAVCWQNLLAELIPGGTTQKPMFDPIIDIINDSISDFLDQKAL
jgi:hypothetical protein